MTASRGPEDLSGERVLRGAATTAFEGAERPLLGRYVLRAKLGQGGAGVVYHAVHQRLGTEAAVKVLPFQLAESHEAVVRRFEREAQLAARLRSEHLVTVLDVDEDPATGCHFIVMEYVHGVSAEDWRRAQPEGRAAEADALDVVIAATRGLAAAHVEGIVHRDVKPSNVLIPCDAADRPRLAAAKLADLGLARAESADQSLTTTHAAMGTPGYLAPEQAQDAKSVRKPADVFAMGATLYALLAGNAPFAGTSAADSMVRAIQGRYDALRDVRSDVSPATAELVEVCLRRAPDERFADASALLDALVAARAALGASPESAQRVVADVRRLADRSEQGVPVATPVSSQTGGTPAPSTGPAPPPAAQPSPPSSGRERVAWSATAKAGLWTVAVGAAAAGGAWALKDRAQDAGEPPRAPAGAPAAAPAGRPDPIVHSLLSDVDTWNVASPARKREAAAWVASREPDFAFAKLETFSAGGRTHEMALFVHPGTGLEFVLVPGGRFRMGSPEDEPGREPGEVQHWVRLRHPFLLARRELDRGTVARRTPGSPFDPADEREALLPVVGARWDQAWRFCQLIGCELPTEAQWEWACRAGTTTPWFTGAVPATLQGYANVADRTAEARAAELFGEGAEYATERDVDDGALREAPVGSYRPNAFGLFDMHGNAAEWVRDWAAPYPAAESVDPVVDTPSEDRMARGGSFFGPSQHNRSALRMKMAPNAHYTTTGFRPAKTVRID